MELLSLIPLLPGASALVLALFGQKLPRAAISVIACVSVFFSFLIAAGYLLFTLGVHLPGFSALPIDSTPLFAFIDAGGLKIDLAFRLDSLSLVMCLVVTGIGFLIHVYSTGYMHHEPDYARFFTYLNLFTFAMLMLVLGSSLVVLFIGWEGVGLCSYLLIGFWYEKKSASDAGKKAFIVNRIGDAGFLIGMMLIYANFGTLEIQPFLDQVARDYPVGSHLLNLIGLCLFIGAAGKSAQIPLYVWLPDAMEGPTPVSALIHAATMVTSGVYMVARLGDMYAKATLVLMLIAWVGALTALMAASIGLVQNDIKRVLAYSTVSQLGYMFLACGVAAFDAAIFHLYTHAFFKALLFLGAGSVIHAMAGEQDIWKMGALKRKMPTTFWTMCMGTFAIAGFPLLSGFYSKDLILEKAFEANIPLWFIGVVTATMTSFYMFRLLNLTFLGQSRVDSSVHPHESPISMTLPLVVLAAGSIGAGWIHKSMTHFVNGSIHGHAEGIGAVVAEEAAHHAGDYTVVYFLTSVAVIVFLAGVLLAYHFYLKDPAVATRMQASWPLLYKLLYNKYFVDEVYGATVVRPIVVGSEKVYERFDLGVIDRTLDTIAAGALGGGRLMSRLQTGNLKAYAAYMLAGAVALVALWVL